MFLFFKQKTAYEMRISDWSSDVCSSDLIEDDVFALTRERRDHPQVGHIAGRKDDRPRHVVKVTQRLLDADMVAEGAVEHPAAVGARTELVECVLACLNDVGIEGHPQDRKSTRLNSSH